MRRPISNPQKRDTLSALILYIAGGITDAVGIRTMKAQLLALMLLGAGAAWAGWTPVSGSEKTYDYIDLDTLRVDGKMRRVMTLSDRTEPDRDGDMSYRVFLEYNCDERKYRSLHSMFFSGAMATGRTTGKTDRASEWRPVAAGTISASVMKTVCSRQ